MRKFFKSLIALNSDVFEVLGMILMLSLATGLIHLFLYLVD